MVKPLNSLRNLLNTIFLDQHLQTICLWKVLFPLLLILIIYPLYALLLKIDYPFQRAFAHGDLLIFSALIMVEAAIELKESKSNYDEPLRFVAMLTMVIFGLVKYGAMLREPHLHTVDFATLSPEVATRMMNESLEAAKELKAFSFFNCAVAACAVSGSIYAFVHAVRHKTSDINKLDQVPD